MTQQSEFALLKALIDLEVASLQQIKNGFARVADHETIMNHYRVIDACYTGLVEHVGEEKATDLVCERMNTIQ